MAFDILAVFCAVAVVGGVGFAFGRRAARRGDRRVAPSGAADSGELVDAAHEMRTPLSGVMGAVDLLLDTGLAPDQRTYARAIQNSADAMLRLVDDLLGVAADGGPRNAMRADTIDVAGLIEEIAELLAPRAQAKGLDFAALVAEGAPAEIVGDAGRLRQILLNLAGNAIKFTAKGGVGLRVERSDAGLAFKVVDTGPGFPAKQAERLFREFERATDAAADGAGLGLPISRKIAEAMGGALTGHAEPGLGATFTLTLPCWAADAASGAEPLMRRRVAVVSDAVFSGPWLVEWLGARGASARLVSSAAVRADPAGALASIRPHVVVIDRSAGDMAELADLARRCGADEVVMMLSPAERKALASLADDGFDAYLVKPLRAVSVLSVLGGAQTAARLAAAPETVAFPKAGGLKVLVAEDDPVSALIALAHLSRLGHASIHVADGVAAVAAYEAESFDIVLVDMRMPRLDGAGAAARMRVAEAASGRAPALIVGLTAEGPGAGGERHGEIDHMLTKPLDRRALEALLAPLRREVAETA
ncbi:ATP-binding protein [Methylopila sp. M107]|uniref:ATP-binding response regulator n=1 Tax=Methylopila sp. M107 TaxID=1101190 RepID=UPI000369CCCB|nr:ATP-binding protein [Methylopila sp. M107]